jgi:hypothetical protein
MASWQSAWLASLVSLTACASASPAPPNAAGSPPSGASSPSPVAAPSEAAPEAALPLEVPAGNIDARRAELKKARASFEAFILHGDGRPEYADAVARAKERIADIDKMLIFLDGQASER